MEPFTFPGQHFIRHDQSVPHEACWCRGAGNLVEFMHDIKSSLRSLVREEVEEVVRRVILPHLSSAPDSTPPASSLPRQTEPSASKTLYLRFVDTALPETLFTMTKIKHQVDSLKVHLVDNLGTRVEDGPESSAKIRIVVLNGELVGGFEVDDNDWSKEKFNQNLVQPRKDKASSLLKGKCEISLSRGVATVCDISFTDNSNRSGTFRLGAEVTRSPAGADIKAGVSKPFTVKERRLLCDRKHEKPSPEDELWRLKNIRRHGPVYQRAIKANICTVNDFLQLLHTDPKRLKNILDVPETKWKDIVENAEACVLTTNLYRYYDTAAGVELLLNCAFNIESVKFTGQISQLYESLSDHQKEVVHKARLVAYENRRELYEVSSMQIQPQVTCLHRIQSRYMQHTDATTVAQDHAGELAKCVYSPLHGSPSCHRDQENPEPEISEGQPLDNPDWLEQLIASWSQFPEDPAKNNPVTKLRAACCVSIAATIFIAGKQNHSPLKKKRRL
ncbi:hypothetical protein vseg_021546 [Gypsophila vaccaria]